MPYVILQLTLVISTSLISNNRLSRSENLVPVYHGNLTSSNKILWKRGEIAPQMQYLLFSTIFSIYLQLQEPNYIYICEMWLFDLFCPQFCKSDMSRYGYLEVFRESLGLRDNEIRLYFYSYYYNYYSYYSSYYYY